MTGTGADFYMTDTGADCRAIAALLQQIIKGGIATGDRRHFRKCKKPSKLGEARAKKTLLDFNTLLSSLSSWLRQFNVSAPLLRI